MRLIDDFERALRMVGVHSGARVGLAVSGGADSTALAHLAVRTSARGLGLELHVLHVDHALRAASEEDARAVAGLAEDLGLACTALRAPVQRVPRSSLEAECRRVRYFALARAASALGLDHVATGHTLDDQAETVLLRAIRGTGVAGLGSIAAVRGPFVRPLLAARRAELREWLAAEGIRWREDASNRDESFDRNWIRARVLPVIESRRPGAPVALARLARTAAADARIVDEVVAARAAAVRTRAAGWLEVPHEVLAEPASLAARVALALLRGVGARVDESSAHALLAVASGEGPRAIVLGGGVVAARTPAGVSLVAPCAPPDPVELPVPGTVDLASWGWRVRASCDEDCAWGWRCGVPRGSRLLVRGRRPGDRVPTSGGTRKVQDVLVDAKVPRAARDRVPVLCVDGRPVAVVGLTTPQRSSAFPEAPGWTIVDAQPLEADPWNATPSRRST